jgi:hypothetical protein
MSLPHAWPVDQVVTEATRGRAAVLEHVHRRPRHTWHSARSRGHAQSTLRAESSPSRALLACGHSKMASAAEVFPQLYEPAKSFGKTDFNAARPPSRSVQQSNWSGERMDRRRVNVEKPMLLKNRQKFSSLMSPRAATRRYVVYRSATNTTDDTHSRVECNQYTRRILVALLPLTDTVSVSFNERARRPSPARAGAETASR